MVAVSTDDKYDGGWSTAVVSKDGKTLELVSDISRLYAMHLVYEGTKLVVGLLRNRLL